MSIYTETWRMDPRDGVHKLFSDADPHWVFAAARPTMMGESRDLSARRMSLAAAAPMLVRALLAAEWRRWHAGTGLQDLDEWCCPSCGADAHETSWHDNNCATHRALTAAGLDTREKRDAIRREMSGA